MRWVDRASDAAAYIEHGNVVSIGHHSSAVLHINMWWWNVILFLCGFKHINGYLLHTHICKTYNPFRAEEATFLFTVLYILYTVRCYLQLHMIRYHAILSSWMNWTIITELNLFLNDNSSSIFSGWERKYMASSICFIYLLSYNPTFITFYFYNSLYFLYPSSWVAAPSYSI